MVNIPTTSRSRRPRLEQFPADRRPGRGNRRRAARSIRSMRCANPCGSAAGLSRDKMLDRASQVRGWDALKRFGERLRDFHPDHVRAVATNTLRVAKNADEFLGEARSRARFSDRSDRGARGSAPHLCGRGAFRAGKRGQAARGGYRRRLDGVHHRLALHADPHGKPVYRLREP